jgi:hypothetical protein
MPANTSKVRGAEEYLEFTLTERASQDLSGDTVTLALVTADDPDLDSATWLPCLHVAGTSWRTNDVFVWSAENYPAQRYLAYADVVDTPEEPRVFLGVVTIA